MVTQQLTTSKIFTPFAGIVSVALLFFLPATAGKLMLGKGKALFVSDGFYYYSYTVSLVLDRDLDFTNQYRFNKGWARPITEKTASGRPANPVGIGCGLLWLPAFVLVHGIVKVAQWFGIPLTATGYEIYYQLPTYFWSFLLGLLATRLLYRLLKEIFEEHYAFWAVVGILFGTALSNYAFLHANMSHWVSAATAIAYLYAVYRLTQAPNSLSRWVIAGALLGVSTMVRYQNSALGLLLVGVLWQLGRKRAWRTLLIGLTLHFVTTFVAFIPQMLAWKAIYGAWLTNPYGAYGARVANFSQGLPWNFFYLPWLFLRSPLLLVGIYGMARPMPRIMPRFFIVGVMLALLAQLHVNLSMPEIGGYGVRRMTDFFPYFAFGLANAFAFLEKRWQQLRPHVLVLGAIALNWVMIAHHYLSTLVRTGSFRF